MVFETEFCTVWISVVIVCGVFGFLLRPLLRHLFCAVFPFDHLRCALDHGATHPWHITCCSSKIVNGLFSSLLLELLLLLLLLLRHSSSFATGTAGPVPTVPVAVAAGTIAVLAIGIGVVPIDIDAVTAAAAVDAAAR